MADITRTPGGTQKLLEDSRALLIELRNFMKTDQMRQYDIVDALRGIGYVLLTDDSIDEFAAWDTLREYPLDEHTLGE